MADTTLGDAAWIGFITVLAQTIVRLDELPPEERTSERFLQGLDTSLGHFVTEVEKEGTAVRGNVGLIREALEKGIGLMRLAQTKGTKH